MKNVIQFPLPEGVCRKILVPMTTLYTVDFSRGRVLDIDYVNNLVPFQKQPKKKAKKKSPTKRLA